MSSSIRNFIVVFLSFLLLFGICGHFIVNDIVPGLMDKDDTAELDSLSEPITDNISSNTSTIGDFFNSSDDVPTFDVEEASYNFAVFCLDLDEELVGVYAIHVNDFYKSQVTTFIPGTATTEIGGSTLAQLYKFKGKDFFLEKLYYLTDLKFDDYCTLYSFDKDGGGKSITELSSYLEYKYRINTPFEYPNPEFSSDIPNNESADESADSVDDNESTEAKNEEYYTVPAGSYSLNGLTEGLQNYKMLLDSEYNPNVPDIFEELLSRLFSDTKILNDSSRQAKVMKYFTDTSYGNFSVGSAVSAVFNNYTKNSFVTTAGGINDWDNVKEYFSTLEITS